MWLAIPGAMAVFRDFWGNKHCMVVAMVVCLIGQHYIGQVKGLAFGSIGYG
jgi:hypothetical protein